MNFVDERANGPKAPCNKQKLYLKEIFNKTADASIEKNLPK
jgi:hypothetical protein